MALRIITATVMIAAMFAAPAYAQSDRVLRVSFAAAVTAHGADIATSCYCLGAKTCHELNPALRWAEDKPLAFGAAKMGIATGTLLASAALARRGHRKTALIVNIAQAVVFTSIALRNARTTR